MISVQGMNVLLRKIAKADKEVQAKVKRANQITSLNIERGAKQNAPSQWIQVVCDQPSLPIIRVKKPMSK